MVLNYGSSATKDVSQIAGKYSVVVLNPDDTKTAAALRAADPTVKIYAYMDLSSVRSYDGDRAAVSVSYEQARANGWLAKDVNGNPIEWNGYAGHYQAAVWDPGYQQAWAARAEAVLGEGFDGIMADNAMSTLSHYSNAYLSGTSSSKQTDAQIQAALGQLISTAGKAVTSKGGALVPNISDGRLNPEAWKNYSAYGGGMEENFMTWSTGNSSQPNVFEYQGGGWTDQASLIGQGGPNLAVTSVTKGDTRSALYGYSSFLMFARPGDGWMATVYGSQAPATVQEQSIRLGAPAGAATDQNGVKVRSFQGGWAAVNPTQKPLMVTAPAGVLDSNGKPIGTVTLAPTSGIVGQKG